MKKVKTLKGWTIFFGILLLISLVGSIALHPVVGGEIELIERVIAKVAGKLSLETAVFHDMLSVGLMLAAVVTGLLALILFIATFAKFKKVIAIAKNKTGSTVNVIINDKEVEKMAKVEKVKQAKLTRDQKKAAKLAAKKAKVEAEIAKKGAAKKVEQAAKQEVAVQPEVKKVAASKKIDDILKRM